MIKEELDKKRNLFFKPLIIIVCLVILGLLSFTSYALITQGNFGALFGGKGTISDRPVPPSNRETIIITKHNKDDVVIQSGYNYVFQGEEKWGTEKHPIDLNSINLIKGAQDEPLDAYIDGGNNYFKYNLISQEASSGLLGVFSGAIVDFNIYKGNGGNHPKAAVFASVLTSQGVIYNCSNFLDVSSYGKDEFSAGFVENLEGTIIKSVNYGDITANGYASGFANIVKGKIYNCKNYGKIESKDSKAAGIANEVLGSIKNAQNLGKIDANKGAAGIAIKVKGGEVADCVNGSSQINVQIYASSAQSVGIVYEVKSVEVNGQTQKGIISRCINYADIDGHEAFGIAYSVQGDVTDSKNYGLITSYDSCAGIADYIEGNLTNTQNHGAIIGDNEKASGLVHKIKGNIIGCQNNGDVKTAGGHASGIAFEFNGYIINSKNLGQVRKTSWDINKYAAGVVSVGYGQIINCQNQGQIIVDNLASYVGGIAAIMSGQIINTQSSGKIIQNNMYQPITVGGIAAVLNNENSPLIEDCVFSGGFDIKSNQARKHYIAYEYPSGTIKNCVGMGKEYNL
jgi:hypothetical protein